MASDSCTLLGPLTTALAPSTSNVVKPGPLVIRILLVAPDVGHEPEVLEALPQESSGLN